MIMGLLDRQNVIQEIPLRLYLRSGLVVSDIGGDLCFLSFKVVLELAIGTNVVHCFLQALLGYFLQRLLEDILKISDLLLVDNHSVLLLLREIHWPT